MQHLFKFQAFAAPLWYLILMPEVKSPLLMSVRHDKFAHISL